MSEQKAVPAVGFEDKYYVLLKIEFQDFDQVFKWDGLVFCSYIINSISRFRNLKNIFKAYTMFSGHIFIIKSNAI